MPATAALPPCECRDKGYIKHWHTRASTGGLNKEPLTKTIALLSLGTTARWSSMKIYGYHTLHLTYSKLMLAVLLKPIAPNKNIVMYLKLAGWSQNLGALEDTWHLEGERACYKEPLKQQ